MNVLATFRATSIVFSLGIGVGVATGMGMVFVYGYGLVLFSRLLGYCYRLGCMSTGVPV